MRCLLLMRPSMPPQRRGAEIECEDFNSYREASAIIKLISRCSFPGGYIRVGVVADLLFDRELGAVMDPFFRD
jgi:hypothetical protein